MYGADISPVNRTRLMSGSQRAKMIIVLAKKVEASLKEKCTTPTATAPVARLSSLRRV